MTEGAHENSPPDGVDQAPGTFREMPDEPLIEQAEQVERTPEPHPDLVAKYRLFGEKLAPKLDLIYHPCGANDISPSVAFPDSRVVYADIDDASMTALRAKGLEANTASALQFDPGEVDVLIMLNPAISPDIPSSHVVEGGYVLCNDYHGTATQLQEQDNYELAAMIRRGEAQELLWDTENLDDYWREIETDEEFRRAPFDWGAVNYQMAAPVVERVTGKRENVLEEYKKILAMARDRERQRNVATIAEQPEFADLLEDPDIADVLMFDFEGQQLVLPTQLPRKKGTVDDLFVFKKVGDKEAAPASPTNNPPETE